MKVKTAKKAHNLIGERIVYFRLIANALNIDKNFDSIPLLPKNDYLLTKFIRINKNFSKTQAHMFKMLKSCLTHAITTKGLKYSKPS